MIRSSLSLLTEQRRLILSRTMQVILIGLFTVGLIERNPKVLLNTGVAVAITFLPALLRRNYRLHLNPGLALWVTSAVFLHTIGSAGFYHYFGWWDHLTHALSASLVAAIGYTTLRSIDLYTEEVHLPSRVMFGYILIFVLAFGVIWEIFEYGLDVVAEVTGVMPPLSQLGLADTVNDLIFNSIGAIVVATFGQLYLSPVAAQIRDLILEREAARSE